MDWAVYAALIVAALAVAAAIAFLVVRILQGWRALKRFRRHLAKSLTDLADGAERTGEIVERISDQSELEQSLGRLRLGLARFNVLRAAVDEVTDSLTRVTAVYPRK
jgi:hypothetical protein